MKDLIDLSTGNAALIGLLGYLVVFFGVFLLMLVVLLLGRIMRRRTEKAAPPEKPEKPEKPVPEAGPVAPGRGEVELYGTNPRDAAVIMAIVANRLGKPLEELRFKSIKEVK